MRRGLRTRPPALTPFPSPLDVVPPSPRSDAAARAGLIDHLASLKPTLLSAPFHRAFAQSLSLQSAQAGAYVPGGQDQPAEQKGELMVLRYRANEAIYIQASGDRVTVIFATMFSEETDRVFG